VVTSADVAAHYGRGAVLDGVRDALAASGLPATGVDPAALAPLDQFHTGGRAATEELLALLPVGPGTGVLDVGAGLGGPARLVAHRRGCRVTCLDLTPGYCAAARLLTAVTGLSERVGVVTGDATALPFADGSFDVVWMQNSTMNIADKARLLGEARRVLVPGGHLALQEVVAGATGLPVHFPVPWADTPELSRLVEPEVLRGALVAAGLAPRTWDDINGWALDQPVTPPRSPLGLHVYVPDVAAKRRNSRRSMHEGRCALLRVTATAA
jgi:sarcosine/dimethylglycine N-methyltransferase